MKPMNLLKAFAIVFLGIFISTNNAMASTKHDKMPVELSLVSSDPESLTDETPSNEDSEKSREGLLTFPFDNHSEDDSEDEDSN